MKDLAPRDASILSLLAQIPKDMSGARRELVESLSADAREIGEAVLAGARGGFSDDARSSAAQVIKWTRAGRHMARSAR